MACKTIDGIFIPGCMGAAALGKHRCTCRNIRSESVVNDNAVRLYIPNDSIDELREALIQVRRAEGMDKKLIDAMVKELCKHSKH